MLFLKCIGLLFGLINSLYPAEASSEGYSIKLNHKQKSQGIIISRDVDPDPVGSAFIWVCGSGGIN